MTEIGFIIVMIVLTIVVLVFACLVLTAPYGIETKDGIRFFKTKDELEQYMKEHRNES
jgi:hypothetical protein